MESGTGRLLQAPPGGPHRGPPEGLHVAFSLSRAKKTVITALNVSIVVVVESPQHLRFVGEAFVVARARCRLEALACALRPAQTRLVVAAVASAVVIWVGGQPHVALAVRRNEGDHGADITFHVAPCHVLLPNRHDAQHAQRE